MARFEKGYLFDGRYRILDWVGAGGMADVYRAEDEVATGTVALKVLSKEFLSSRPKEAERNLRRFKREADILRLLSDSPHVVGIVSDGVSDHGDHYIAMEFLDGEQLRYYIGRGRAAMGVPTFVAFGLHLTQGLGEIHAKGILHRDLAPDNIIVTTTREGTLVPRYLDFGIGKSLAGELDNVTQGLTIMGKPQYFSPEQARGQDLTDKSDIYSLGVVLYEMASGYVPLEIHGIPDFRKIVKEEPRSLAELEEGKRLPARLRDEIMACLAKKAEDRASLAELLEEFTKTKTEIGAEDPGATQAFRSPVDDHDGETRAFQAAPQALLAPGSTIGRYEIKCLLGRGGMGAVYLCWDPQLHRELAIKVATGIEEEQAQKSILREARASSALEHENIVRIYDCGVADRIPYIAMEYVKDGTTVDDLIEEQGTITGERFWEIARGMLRGLASAHSEANPIIHRDLKPANVLVARHRVKITDFGIATRMTSKTMGPESGTHGIGAGTAATMSPEQAEQKAVDHRSDIYSAGCVLYWMACGRPPFTDGGMALLFKKCTEDPPSPLKVNPKLRPRELDPIITKCLARDPDERYQSAGQILADLEPLFVTTGTTSVTNLWYKTPATWIAAAAVLVLLAAAGWWFFRGNGEAPPRNEPPSSVPAILSLEIGGARTNGYNPEVKRWYTKNAQFKIQARFVESREWNGFIERKDGTKVPLKTLENLKRTEAGIEVTLVPDQPGEGLFREDESPEKAELFDVVVWNQSIEGEVSDADRIKFELLWDNTPPVVSWRRRGEATATVVKADGRLNVALLREDDLELLVADEGSGLRRTSDPAPDESYKSEWFPRSQIDSQGDMIIRKDDMIIRKDDQLSFTVVDRAGNESTVQVEITRVDPIVAFLSREQRSQGGTVEIRTSISAPSTLSFPAEGLTGVAVVVTAPSGAKTTVPLTVSATEGQYVGTFELPEIAEAGIHEFTGLVEFDGHELKTNRLSILLDREAPTLTGVPDELKLTRGEGTLKRKLRVLASDGERGAKPEKLEVHASMLDQSSTCAVGRDGVVDLTGLELPAEDEFTLTLVVVDDCGNKSSPYSLPITVQRGQISSVSLAGTSLLFDDAEVAWAQPGESRARVTLGQAYDGIQLLLRLTEKNAAPRDFPLTRENQSSVWVSDPLVIAEGDVDWKVIDRTSAERLVGGKLTVDGTPPTLEIVVAGRTLGATETVLGPFGEFPKIEARIADDRALLDTLSYCTQEDDSGLEAKISQSLEGAAKWEALIDAPESGLVSAAEFSFVFAGRDRAGNPLQSRTLTVRVVRPNFLLSRLGSQPVSAGEFKTSPFITKAPEVAIELANQRKGPRYLIEARSNGREPIKIAELTGTDGVTGKIVGLQGDQTYEITATEMGRPNATPSVIDVVSITRDTVPPDVMFELSDGTTISPLALSKSRREIPYPHRSIKVIVTDNIRLPNQDLPRELEVSLTFKKDEQQGADQKARRIYRLVDRASSASEFVVRSFTVSDYAGNEFVVDGFTILMPPDAPERPEVFTLANGSQRYTDTPLLVKEQGSSATFTVTNRAPDIESLFVEISSERGGESERFGMQPGANDTATVTLDLRQTTDGVVRKDGLYTARVQYHKKNKSGDIELAKQSFRIDTTAPRLVVTVDSKEFNGQSLAYARGMNIVIFGRDESDSRNLSPESATLRSTDGSERPACDPASTTVKIDPDADAGKELTLLFHAVDLAGNVASPRSLTISVPEKPKDITPPVLVMAVNEVSSSLSAVTFSEGTKLEIWAQDETDGRLTPEATLSELGGSSRPALTSGGTLVKIDPVADAGKTFTLRFSARDAALNSAPERSVIISVPARSVVSNPPPEVTPGGGTITLKKPVTDSETGIQYVGIPSNGGAVLMSVTEVSNEQFDRFKRAIQNDRSGVKARVTATLDSFPRKHPLGERAKATMMTAMGPIDAAIDAAAQVSTSTGASLPVTGVPIKVAAIYSLWAGGRLPADAEWWEAAGGRGRRSLPERLSTKPIPVTDGVLLGDYQIRGLAGNVHEYVIDGRVVRGRGASADSVRQGKSPDYELESKDWTPTPSGRNWGIRVVRDRALPDDK